MHTAQSIISVAKDRTPTAMKIFWLLYMQKWKEVSGENTTESHLTLKGFVRGQMLNSWGKIHSYTIARLFFGWHLEFNGQESLFVSQFLLKGKKGNAYLCLVDYMKGLQWVLIKMCSATFLKRTWETSVVENREPTCCRRRRTSLGTASVSRTQTITRQSA